MSGKTRIEWSEITWNPVTGCSKISTGCKFCYAERWASMQHKRGISQYKNAFNVTIAENRLKEPYKWTSKKLVFVNSMSDLFHEEIPLTYLKEIFAVMNDLSNHTFQVLTKRIDRAVELTNELSWTSNIWLGVSVENSSLMHRIDTLKTAKAVVKFISFEPLLGPITKYDYSGIHWVLVGGESGGKARPIEKKWVVDIHDECYNQNIPFFFKQWGKRDFNPDHNDPTLNKNHPSYSKGGCMIDNSIHREFPIN